MLSNVVSSQVPLHERFGGIVPEIAARRHAEIITRIIDRALREANVELSDLDAIAVTNRPGLIGALLVGVEAAKALAFVAQKPLVPVHHIEGHILAPSLAHPVPFPHVCLTVAGGHTLLVLVREGWKMEVLGSTLDDAVGEAYDKVAKLLGLGFPGGPVIDRLANEWEGEPVEFPRPMVQADNYDFSFAGLKTAVRYYLERNADNYAVGAVAAGFQIAAVETLLAKTFRAAEAFRVQAVTVTGGVSANRYLRRRVAEEAQKRGMEAFVPPLSLCTDNGAMIAAVGYRRWLRGELADWTLTASPSAPIEGF
ncbi:MAG: DNA-binding/iron metalloprotein/AP endonuclease [Candidatus Poribacteria bacterium]|nr:MAG: DNA-binding/iron metalloprotein/AP endonuclease [Candidatus Poribacteria bacterium]